MAKTRRMIKTIVIEDEPRSLKNLLELIKQNCPNIDVVDSIDSVQDAYSSITTHNPELVIADIMLKGGNIFDLLAELNPITFEIIFITAYNDFAIKAFKYSALDYILKPIDTEDLIRAVNKSRSQDNYLRKINNLLDNLKKGETPQLQKIGIPSKDGIEFVPIKDIVRCEASESYSKIACIDGQSYMISQNLKSLEGHIQNENFVRVHNSHLINLDHIKKYNKIDGGFLIMTDEAVVPISKRKKKDLLDKIRIV